MRNVPKLRFKEFSEEWKEKKFKDLVLLQRGSSPRPIVKYITTSLDGVNWIKIGDTNKENRFITSTSEKITKEGAKKSREVKKGEIILSNSMSYGRPFILKIDGYIHDGWFVLRNYEENLNKEFLCQLLGSEIVQKQYKKLAAGGVVENISSELVNAIIINLPNLEEQEKIADFLSSIDKKISITEEKLDLFKDYKKGIMQKIFNQELRFKDSEGNDYPEWEEKEVRNLVKDKIIEKPLDGNHGSLHPTSSDYVLSGIPFIMANDINKNSIDLKECKKISKEQAKTLQKGFSKEGDILLTHKGSIGRTCIVPKLETDYIILTPQVTYYRILNNRILINKYLKSYFESPNFVKILEVISSSGTRPYIGITEQLELKIQLPCLEEQEKIANFLSSIDNKIDNLTSELEDLKEFKKGLLQQMFV